MTSIQPTRQTIAELFTDQADRTPSSIAVQAEGVAISYAELNERANQLGRYLQSLGVGPDQLVGICLDRSIELIISILGVLKAGGAYVPLDPAYPAERLNFMLKDSGAIALITDDRLQQSKIEHYTGQVINLDAPSIQKLSRADIPASASSNNLVYVIYTSGSTGNPKV